MNILKKGLFLLVAVLPMSCSSDDEEEKINGTIIEEIDCGSELSDFLNEQLPLVTAGFPPFFYDEENNKVKDVIIINNKEDFSRVFPEFDTSLLDIDFSVSSLVIGHKAYKSGIGNKAPKELIEQILYQTENGYAIEIKCSYYIIKADLAVLSYVNFWGVYPIQDVKDLTVKIKFVK